MNMEFIGRLPIPQEIKAQYPLTQHYPKPGWVEHDAA